MTTEGLLALFRFSFWVSFVSVVAFVVLRFGTDAEGARKARDESSLSAILSAAATYMLKQKKVN